MTGKLEITQDQDNGEEPIASSLCNQKQPQTVNKATGKSSTKGTAFSLQNWGGQTLSYYNSISNRSMNTLGNIVAGALCSLATTDSSLPGSFGQPLLCGLRNQISGSTHSSVVQGHVEFLTLGSSSSDDEKSVRPKSH